MHRNTNIVVTQTSSFGATLLFSIKGFSGHLANPNLIITVDFRHHHLLGKKTKTACPLAAKGSIAPTSLLQTFTLCFLVMCRKCTMDYTTFIQDQNCQVTSK